MKHVIALDVSKGKSTVAIYDGHRQCVCSNSHYTGFGEVLYFLVILSLEP
ncbi:hypothetical protein [Lysinibacillus sphaericus]|nr:hypothetical protein [Lysinibacillus sphaericus]